MELVNTISMKKTRLKNFSNSGWKIFNMQRKKCCVFKIVWSYEKVQDKSLFLFLNSKVSRRLIG